MSWKITKTFRGFPLIEFKDNNDSPCSIQDSSSAMEPKIWLGVDDPDPKTLQSGVGWVPYPLSSDVHMTTRMHLTIEQAEVMIIHLQRFVDNGSLEVTE